MPAKNKQKKHITEHGLFKSAMVIILAVIVVTFIGAPVVGGMGGAPAFTFGSFRGVPIVFQEGNYFHQQVQSLNSQYESVTNFEFKLQLVWRQAFERAAMQIAMKTLAEQSGIIVTEKELADQLSQYYTDSTTGKPSQEIYDSVPAMDRVRLSNETKLDLLLSRYYQRAISNPKVEESTVDFIAQQIYPQRKFSFVVLGTPDFPATEVKAYAEAHPELFRSIGLSRITVKDGKSAAEKVLAEAVKGERTFDTLAQSYSKDDFAALGGALGTKLFYELRTEFDKPEDLEALFALGEGQLSALVQRENDWIIYKVTKGAQLQDVNATESLTIVRSYMENNERGLIEDYLEKLAVELKATASAQSLERAAAAFAKSVETTDFFPLNYGSLPYFPSVAAASQNSAFQTLANNEEFFKKAFSLKRGEISDPVLASPAVIVLRLDEEKTSGALPADQEREMIRNYILQSRGRDMETMILKSPDFKDDFKNGIAQVYPGLSL